jgi:hypothetical protein
MRIVASKQHICSFATLSGMEPEKPALEKTPQVEQEEADVKFSTMRRASKEAFPNSPKGLGETFKEEVSDTDAVVKQAAKLLKKTLDNKDLLGQGGYSIAYNDFICQAQHNSVVDDSVITDKSLIGFEVSFMTPSSNARRIAKFIVEHDENADFADERLCVAKKFYDEDENEYVLSQKNLEKFLSGEDRVMAKKNAEQPLAYFDAEADTLLSVDAPAGTAVVAKRLQDAGFSVHEEYIDACHGPKTFGRICFMVDVPVGKTAEMQKIAVMSNDEWFKRGTDGGKDAGADLNKEEAWFGRGKEQGGYTKRTETESKETWPNRAEEKGKENPYSTEAKMLASDAMKKTAAKDLKTAQKDAQSALQELNDLIK